jgi:molybdopterin molybdotransferase
LEENDIVMLSGGVSMGDFDFVGAALEKNGIKILFDSVAVQPGKPTTFGVGDRKICFGMPGNPVSSFIQFELLAKPLIQKMMGAEAKMRVFKLPLKHDYRRKKAERLAIVPANMMDDNTVESADYHGSAHIFSLGYANALMFIPLGVNELKAGDFVDVGPL